MANKEVVIPNGQEVYYEQYHFAPAIKDGNRLYCSGVIGVGADGKPPADPEAQFVCAFEGVKSVLEAAGVGFEQVLEMTTFHVGLQQHLGTFMKVKDRYVAKPYPAWTAIGVSRLLPDSGITEIKIIARKPPAAK